MANAETLINDYVLAGFTKIDIDTSMRLGCDDKTKPLSNEVIAKRGAKLCAVAEKAFAKRKNQLKDAVAPIYIVGSEVPIPGGAQEHEELSVTGKDECIATIAEFLNAFKNAGLSDVWERVVAVVVQPGVEFGEDDVDVYDSEKAKELRSVLSDDKLVFEGHSTDYQPRPSLRELVRDGVIILKVGPALTFALREALFALESIERVLLAGKGKELSRFSEVLETVMLEKPSNWNSHYHGDEHKLKINRAFGFSDRARYYLPEQAVAYSIETLVSNLSRSIPLPILSQFLPLQYARVRDGELKNAVDDIILDKIGDCIDDYIYAVK
jgi:D-tagatose-1,6-bisphosphate aldolase subunit GatZ/KbaZ